MMINIGTLILCCILSAFIGFELALWKSSKDLKKHFEDMERFYRENTRAFAETVLKRLDNDKKGGES